MPKPVVFLFCLLDNDAEVIFPLFRRILDLEADAFDERVAGELLRRTSFDRSCATTRNAA